MSREDNKSVQIAESSMQSIPTTRREKMDPELRNLEKLYRRANIIVYHIQKVQCFTNQSRFTKLTDLFGVLNHTVMMMERAHQKLPANPVQQ